MASSSSSKVPCAICGGKSVGIFKCEGCLQAFCRKHSSEHRDLVSHQLEGIVLEHDQLQQKISESKSQQPNQHPLFAEIDKWERDSIVKIQQTAEQARREVEKFTSSNRSK